MKTILLALLFFPLFTTAQTVKGTPKKTKFSGRETTATRMEIKKGKTIKFTGDVYVINVSSSNAKNNVTVTFENGKTFTGKGMYVELIKVEDRLVNDSTRQQVKQLKESKTYYNKASPTRSVKVSQNAVIYYFTVTSKKK